ncbi:MAG: sulfatase [Myxococcota bacterium]
MRATRPPPAPPGLAELAGAGVCGGLCGGSLAGVVEALWVLSATRPSEYQALLVADVAYGVAGAAIGGALAIPIALLRFSRAFTWAACAAGAAAGLGGWAAFDVAGRVVWHEHGIPGAAAAAIAGGLAVAATIGLWLARLLLVKTPLRVVATPRGTAVAWLAGTVIVALFASTPAPGGEGRVAPGRTQGEAFRRKPDVVLIVVGGLRADALGSEADTPRLDAFAREAVVFEQHVAASSHTPAATASLLTSRSPGSHGVATPDAVLPDAAVTLAEVMRDGGYVTAGLPAESSVAGAWGFDQGFDWYPSTRTRGLAVSSTLLTILRAAWPAGSPPGASPAAAQVARARAFVEAQGRDRFFLMVHLGEPGAAATGDDPRAGYRAGLRAADVAFGALADALGTAGRYGDAVIVVVADRGTELGDHGGWGAANTLYDEMVHVPLMVRLPRAARAGTRVPWQVRQVDVAPTIVDLVGLAADPGWEGASLLDDDFDDALAAAGPPPGLGPDDPPWTPPTWDLLAASRDAVAGQDVGGYTLHALRADGHKLVRAARVPGEGARLPAGFRCFDLRADPGEASPLAREACDGSLPARLDAMVQEREARRVREVLP